MRQMSPAYFPLRQRRYLLYSTWAKRLYQIRQSDQILRAKPGPSAAYRNERVDASGIRAIRPNRL